MLRKNYRKIYSRINRSIPIAFKKKYNITIILIVIPYAMLKVCNHRAGTIYDITIFIQLRPFVVILETTYTRYNLSVYLKKPSTRSIVIYSTCFLRYELLHGTFVRKKIFHVAYLFLLFVFMSKCQHFRFQYNKPSNNL